MLHIKECTFETICKLKTAQKNVEVVPEDGKQTFSVGDTILFVSPEVPYVKLRMTVTSLLFSKTLSGIFKVVRPQGCGFDGVTEDIPEYLNAARVVALRLSPDFLPPDSLILPFSAVSDLIQKNISEITKTGSYSKKDIQTWWQWHICNMEDRQSSASLADVIFHYDQSILAFLEELEEAYYQDDWYDGGPLFMAHEHSAFLWWSFYRRQVVEYYCGACSALPKFSFYE